MRETQSRLVVVITAGAIVVTLLWTFWSRYTRNCILLNVRSMKAPPRVETCRAHSLKCRDAAERATNKPARDQFLDLAQHWEDMAYDIENIQALRLSLEMDRELHAAIAAE